MASVFLSVFMYVMMYVCGSFAMSVMCYLCM